MKKPVLKFLRLNKNAKIPDYSYNDDAAFNLFSIEKVIIKPREHKVIHLGIASEISTGYFASIRGRSSLAGKYGIDVLGGVIDSGYRGEWMIILSNIGKQKFEVQIGDKIAQGILQLVPSVKIIEVKKLSESVRGEKGFGSSGRK